MGEEQEQEPGPESAVWKLELARHSGGLHIARFGESFVTSGDGTELVAQSRPDFARCKPPVYMWKDQEEDTFSDDEADVAQKEKVANGPKQAYERPKFKGPRSKRPVPHWMIQDSQDPSQGGMSYVADQNRPASKYVLFEVQEDSDEPLIKVIPVDEWWKFEKQTLSQDEKMSVAEAMEVMRQQQLGYDVSNRHRDLKGKLKTVEQDVDEAGDTGGGAASSGWRRGRAKAEPQEGLEGTADGPGADEEAPGADAGMDDPAADDALAAESDGEGDVGSGGGDDEQGIDFDEVFSDDEGNVEDVNNAEAELDSSDAESAGEEGEETPGQSLLKKALDTTESGAEQDDNDDDEDDLYTIEAIRRSPVPGPNAPEAAAPGTDLPSPVPAGRKRPADVAPEGAPGPKRPPAANLNLITEEMIIAEMRRVGGKMKQKRLLLTFKKQLKASSENREIFKQLTKKLVVEADDALEGKVLKLKDFFQ
jgi:hypothetical protein